LAGSDGPRSELRRDDIMIGPWVGMEEHILPEALIYANGQSIMTDIREAGPAAVSVFNLQGRLVHAEQLPGYEAMPLNRPFRPGLYIVRIETPNNVFQRKIIIN
jgi:hypothetical protein